MKTERNQQIAAWAIAALLGLTAPAMAGESAATAETHETHDHAHDHSDAEVQRQIYKGIFTDDQIAARDLSDWSGDWQSVYPLLVAGELDPVMSHKAATGDKTAEEYRSYYETGYQTDVERVTIAGDRVTFHRAGGTVQASYASDGHEILTYEKGNRGVRFVFEKTEGDADAPQFIQFSDHKIAPAKADHYHLYWGDDRAEVLAELSNWPTYYPAAMNADQIVAEMTAH